MGYRDDSLSAEERAEAALRRALAQLGEPATLEPPPALVSRTARRLPALSPAQAARAAQAAALMRLLTRAGAALVVALVVLAGALSMLGGEWLARLFGDGSTGLSRTLLTVQLLAKPLWRTVGAVSPAQLAVGVALVAGGAALWWWLARLAPRFALERGP
jgi:hypothetical protein